MDDHKHFLPITKKEMEKLGWEQADVILVSGDAYVDHPSFGPAIIARILEREGLKVAILPQPNWQDDLRDFRKLGSPRLFFGITAGNMDSMVNHYTANKRLRSNDAYTAGGKAGFRPDYASVVYSKIIRKLFPDVPIILGGIEASMRRLSHYDFWSDALKPSILPDSEADLLVYGMGEKPITELASAFKTGNWKDNLEHIRQIAFLTNDIGKYENRRDVIWLHSYEAELKNPKKYGENFVLFETESNKKIQRTLIQPYGDQYLVIKPPYPVPTEKEMDDWAMYGRMMNAPHPKYLKRGDIPAFEMIKNSITMHRGCFGGCSFCTISAHQGKHVASRSERSILNEVEDLIQRPYFKGHITDLGGPSANMYKMSGFDEKKCQVCHRPSCLFPEICRNLNYDHEHLVKLYRRVQNMKGVKKVTIGSGIRYEMLVTNNREIDRKYHLSEYTRAVVHHHVSGRLKVAPEHTAVKVTALMRKPPFSQFILFLQKFNELNRECGKNQQLIPYFISGHPGTTTEDMASLAVTAKKYRLHTDQVQEFTPTPMTLSTTMFYLGYNPYTQEKIKIAKNIEERKKQHQFFFSMPKRK